MSKAVARGTVNTDIPQAHNNAFPHVWRTWDAEEFTVTTRQGATRPALSLAEKRRRATYL